MSGGGGGWRKCFHSEGIRAVLPAEADALGAAPGASQDLSLLRMEGCRCQGPFLQLPASSQHGNGIQQPGKVPQVSPSLATSKPCPVHRRFPGGKGKNRAANGTSLMDVCSRCHPSAPRDGIHHLCPAPSPTWGKERGEGDRSHTACLFSSADRGFAGAGGIHLAERALFFMEEMRQRAFNRK